MRPLLSVMFVPSTPMNEERLSIAGSFRITRASACWRSAMAENETVCGASDTPRITPVSWTGKKPLGITMYKRTVAASVATATASVAGWCRMTQVSVRP